MLGTRRTTSDEVIDIKAVNMAYIDVIVSGERAKRVSGKSQTHGSPHTSQMLSRTHGHGSP